MKDVVIVSACRTPIGAFGGTLRDLDAAGFRWPAPWRQSEYNLPEHLRIAYQMLKTS
jgi:hypothetical protein